jgi:hypothetical protein
MKQLLKERMKQSSELFSMATADCCGSQHAGKIIKLEKNEANPTLLHIPVLVL